MKRFFITSFKVLNVLLVLSIWCFFVYLLVEKQKKKEGKSNYNVALIKINGTINTKLADVTFSKIENAVSDTKVKAILFEINSGGGEVSPSFEIESMIASCNKYNVSYVRGTAASGAYLIASATDSIYASISSKIGSISVKTNAFDISKKNEKEGKTVYNLTSGKFKNMTDSNFPITMEERTLIMSDLLYHHENFVSKVAENRNETKESIQLIADGRVFYGNTALDLKLIDKIVENKNDVIKSLYLKLNEKISIKEF